MMRRGVDALGRRCVGVAAMRHHGQRRSRALPNSRARSSRCGHPGCRRGDCWLRDAGRLGEPSPLRHGRGDGVARVLRPAWRRPRKDPRRRPRPSRLARPAPAFGYEAPEGILPPGSRVVVVVDGLQLRGEPGLDGSAVRYRGGRRGSTSRSSRVRWRLMGSLRPACLRSKEASRPGLPAGLAPTATSSSCHPIAHRLTLIWQRSPPCSNGIGWPASAIDLLTVEGTYGCPPAGGCGGQTFGSFAPAVAGVPVR